LTPQLSRQKKKIFLSSIERNITNIHPSSGKHRTTMTFPINMPYGLVSTGPLISDDENDDNEGNIPLPDGYKPAPQDVICARGKAYWDHPGNQRYRELISSATPKYSETANKLEKTLIVSEIVQAIHEANGKFIKKLKKGGPFVIVSEVFAREKVRSSRNEHFNRVKNDRSLTNALQ
jgi:hypothetical protein